MSEYYLTPVGVMVQGHPLIVQDKNMEGQPLVSKKTGLPRVNHFFAMAIPKIDQQFTALHAQIKAEAALLWPAGQSLQPGFSMKIDDGDDPKNAGKKGFAGCWILKCNNGFPIKVHSRNGAGLVTNEEDLKRGYFIRAYFDVHSNNSTQKPGIFLNARMVEIVAFGEEIISGPSGADIFGGAPIAALPAGASATPLAPITPLAPVAVAPVAVAPVAVAPVAVAPVAVAHQMTALAGGATYDQCIAMGHTDESLIDQGLMINTTPGVVPSSGVI